MTTGRINQITTMWKAALARGGRSFVIACFEVGAHGEPRSRARREVARGGALAQYQLAHDSRPTLGAMRFGVSRGEGRHRPRPGSLVGSGDRKRRGSQVSGSHQAVGYTTTQSVPIQPPHNLQRRPVQGPFPILKTLGSRECRGARTGRSPTGGVSSARGLGDAAGLSRVVALRREALRPPLLKVRRGVGAKQTKRRVRGGVCGFFGAWT